MADKVVSEIKETYDYDKFSFVEENRGLKSTKGLNERKVGRFLDLINDGKFVKEKGIIYVNKDFKCADGRHKFEALKRTGNPIWYMVMKDERFNDVSRRGLVSAIININGENSAWSHSQIFMAAVQTKAPLAVMIHEAVEKGGNTFIFSDLLAVLTKNEGWFSSGGGPKNKASMEMFEDKKLIEEFTSYEFQEELKWFIKFNNKARVTQRRGLLLKAIYQIIFRAKEVMDIMSFRKSVKDIPDHVIQVKSESLPATLAMLLRYYNSSTGQNIKASTVAHHIKLSVSKDKNAKTIKELATA